MRLGPVTYACDMVKCHEDAVYCGVVLFGVCLGPALMLVQASAVVQQREDDLAVVLFPPWSNAAQALQQAGWHLLGPQQAPFGTLAPPSSTARERIDGAWAVLRNPALIAICTSKEPA